MDRELHHGEGRGWVITNGDHMTPPGYETVFEKPKIPEDEENIERDADQNVRFVNCKRSNNVTLPLQWTDRPHK